MLNLRAGLRFGFLEAAVCLVQCAFLAVLFVRAAPSRDLPDDLAPLMLLALLDARITGVSRHHVLFAMQQLVHLGDVRNIGGCDMDVVHQPRLHIDPDMRLGTEVVLVAFLGLVHVGIAFAFLVLGRTGCMNQRGIDDGALTQGQATVAQVAIDDTENAGSQVMLLQQSTEIEDGRFVRDTLQAQACELAQDGRFIQGLFHCWIAVAEPVLHQVYPQHAING